MEHTLDEQTTQIKIYKERAISLGTFLGGPLAAGYLIAENFKAFNQSNKAKTTWLIAIAATLVVFASVLLIPDDVYLPNQIIPLIYTAIAYSLVQRFQGQQISDHLTSGGQFYSWWRTIAVGTIGLAVTLVPMVGVVLLSENTDNASVSIKTFRAKHEIAYTADNISEAEVTRIGKALEEVTFFDDGAPKYVYAKKVDNTYELSISVLDGIANNGEVLQAFSEIRTNLQTLFPDNKIVFQLVVNSLDNVVKTIE